MSSNRSMGTRIREIRKSLHLSQDEFGKLFDPPLSQTSIYFYETGQREPNMSTLIQLSRLGNRSIDWILKGDEEEEIRLFQNARERLERPYKNVLFKNMPTDPEPGVEYSLGPFFPEDRLLADLAEIPELKAAFHKLARGARMMKEAHDEIIDYIKRMNLKNSFDDE
ncbi:MAG TPA: XRE family transcriptional regulator [Firmicutes bacterium]|mgnify:CR=1 FL=1|nr:XRE family transcriptional regulator [Bacillota bacterium]